MMVLDDVVSESEKGAEFFESQARLLLGRLSPEKVDILQGPDTYQQVTGFCNSEVSELADALHDFEKSLTLPSFGTAYLRGFLKQNQNVSDEEFGKYGMVFDIRQERNYWCSEQGLVYLEPDKYGRHFKYKYFDAPFNLCLTYGGSLIANIGCSPEEGKLVISQIQGTKENGWRLRSFKWERALVTYAVQWAQQYRIPEAVIVSVDNNRWAQFTFEDMMSSEVFGSQTTFEDFKRFDFDLEKRLIEMHLPHLAAKVHLAPNRGFLLYDVTARRCGFKRRPDGNYTKKLIPAPFDSTLFESVSPRRIWQV
ncbi:hypothetical protein HYS49_01175 [Candidatus Woesearchaeota archaeon]|nr:hypothetical protein [Candidatus Woesearchaeota archaeon]